MIRAMLRQPGWPELVLQADSYTPSFFPVFHSS
jgi:hypothetical protein